MTSILIVRLGALGDVVHTMPVVAALRQRWADARIDWMVEPRYADVVRMIEGLDRAVPFDPRALMSGRERGAMVAVLAEMRRVGYDLVLDLQGLVKSAVAARLSGGRETVGFSREHLREPAARFFYTRAIDVPVRGHVIHKNLALLSAIGVPAGTPRFPLKVPSSAAVDGVVQRFGASGFVAMNPGAGWTNKRWPPERFGAVASRVDQANGLKTVVVWGPGEEELARRVVDASDGTSEMAPPTNVTELFALLRHARLMIAGDTGPLQIAAAVGTPVVALFGPTDPARNGPWHPLDISLSRYAQCECHYERRCRRIAACIDDIAVEDVVSAASLRLGRSQGEVAQ